DGDHAGITFDVGWLRSEVENVDDRFGFRDASERGMGNIAWVDRRLPPPPLRIGRGRTMQRGYAENISLTKEQIAELRLAEPGSIRQDGLEHGLQLAGRTRDDLKDIRCRGLLPQRFAQLLGARLHLVE